MKKLIVLSTVLVFAAIFAATCLANELVWENISRENLNLNTILVNHDNPEIIYAGSNNTVIKTDNAGETWRNILTVKGQNKTINFLAFDGNNRNSIYAATGNGLFYSSNRGKTWQKIFNGKNYLESDCSTVLAFGTNIYLGTKKGLFISNDSGRNWYKPMGKLADSHIFSIAAYPDKLQFITTACNEGVFASKDGGHLWEKIFFAKFSKPEEINEQTTAEGENNSITNVRYLISNTNKQSQNFLYLATSKGVYKKFNDKPDWDLLSNYGLLSNDIKSLAIYSDETLYAASKSGIFKYSGQRWQEISLGLNAENITSLDFDTQGNLYAASDNGVFMGKNNFYANNAKINKISFYSENEPEIKDVQNAAVRYAEVAPEKIFKWRKQAQKMAFLPKINTGVNRNTSDLWHWETGSTTKSGDDLINKGKGSVEWDVTLSWDLSQLIWNNDQTAIDARSKLMVELRQELLDEVTKLYFERLRVKMELNNLSIEDSKKRFEKELKLQELTALLDALTSGYFSGQIKNKF